MTKDDTIRMARKAGFVVNEKARQHQPNCIFHTQYMVDELLERFDELARADEREACAKVCEALKPFGPELAIQKATAEDCAAAIRARGQDPMPLFDDWPGGWGKCPPCNQQCNQGRDCPNA